MSHYIVKTSSAKMPSSCWGRYAHVAVLEVEDGVESVSMISERAKGVIRIEGVWWSRNVGKTDRCAYACALKDANALADRLNEPLIAAITRARRLSKNEKEK